MTFALLRFKAQVVATSRRAAATYQEKLEQARQQLVAELEALPPTLLTLPEDEIEHLDASTRFLVRAYGDLVRLRALEIAAVMSFGDHNDPESWRNWTDKARQAEHIQRFKRQLSMDSNSNFDFSRGSRLSIDTDLAKVEISQAPRRQR